MSPATANLLLILTGGPASLVVPFLVARALVLKHDRQMSPEVAEPRPALRRPESIRPPQRKELTAR